MRSRTGRSADGVGRLDARLRLFGHGFKLAPAVDLVLAQRGLGRASEVDIGPYGLSSFAEGRPLTGAYGGGSIS